eukprot:1505299-Amphidinium_carterae.1
MAAAATYMQMHVAPMMQPSLIGVDVPLGLQHQYPGHVTLPDATVIRTIVPQAQALTGPRTT